MKKLYILFFTLLISAVSFGQTTVFINEIHYDNSGSDSGEGVEIAGPAGTDLSTYTITAYNGSNGTFYSATTLSGTIADEGGSGFGTIFFAISGLQNGAPDGIALDNSGTLVQFLSYEGAFSATDGVANGVLSIDIGVVESGSTSVGESLQLTGSGSEYEDFFWASPMASTYNLINTGQTFGAVAPTINVGSAVSGLDYFEGNGPSNEGAFTVEGINLTTNITVTAPANFEVSLTSGSGFGASVIVTQSGGTAASTTVYARLVAGLTSNPYSGDVTASSTGATDKTVNLSGTVSPAVPQITISGFVGDLNYTEGSGPSAEDSFTVEGLFLTTDITVTAPTNFEVSLTSESGFGASVMVAQTGGTAPTTTVYVRLAASLTTNAYSGDVTASSTGATDQLLTINGNVFPTPTCANVGDIIITEVMQNPAAVSDGSGEWFEVYNTTGAPIDMLGWTIKDDTSASETYTIATSVVVPANGYVVFGNNADSGTNGGVTVSHQYSGISLGNGTDGLIIECSSTTIDDVIWDNGATFPDPNGASMELSTTTLNDTSNDVGTNWAAGTTPFGAGDLGSPGLVNNFVLSTNNFEANNFKLYPNPTSRGFVNISSNNSAAMKVTVFDVLGKQVINQIVSNKRLDVSMLNTGVYIMRVTQDNASITKKLVIR